MKWISMGGDLNGSASVAVPDSCVDAATHKMMCNSHTVQRNYMYNIKFLTCRLRRSHRRRSQCGWSAVGRLLNLLTWSNCFDFFSYSTGAPLSKCTLQSHSASLPDHHSCKALMLFCKPESRQPPHPRRTRPPADCPASALDRCEAGAWLAQS